jgi:hypothetical protein
MMHPSECDLRGVLTVDQFLSAAIPFPEIRR